MYCVGMQLQNNLSSGKMAQVSVASVEGLRRVAVCAAALSGVVGCAGQSEIVTVTAAVAASLLIITHLWAPTVRLGAHWRTLPLTASTMSLLAVAVDHGAGGGASQGWVIGLGAVQLLAATITAVLLYLLPVPSALPLPGPLKTVGTTSFNIPDPADPTRPIPCQCWFPLASPCGAGRRLYRWFQAITPPQAVLWTSGNPAEQMQELDLLLVAFAKMAGLPVSLFGHFRLATSSAEWVANPANRLAPVADGGGRRLVLHSHGKFGWRQLDQRCCEALASYGFVAVALDHAPDGAHSRPPGRLAEGQPAAYTAGEDLGHEEEREFYANGIRLRAREISAAIDFVISSKLFGEDAIDTQKVGLWGHSYGGGACAVAASRDPRVAAAVLLDAWMWPVPDDTYDESANLASVATIAVSAHKWSYGKFQVPFRSLFVDQCNPDYSSNVVIRGTSHQNFCELPLSFHRRLLTRDDYCGSADPARVCAILRQIVAGHFLATLSPTNNDSIETAATVVGAAIGTRGLQLSSKEVARTLAQVMDVSAMDTDYQDRSFFETTRAATIKRLNRKKCAPARPSRPPVAMPNTI